jgi:NAD-specific glutamate dehydrogenase
MDLFLSFQEMEEEFPTTLWTITDLAKVTVLDISRAYAKYIHEYGLPSSNEGINALAMTMKEMLRAALWRPQRSLFELSVKRVFLPEYAPIYSYIVTGRVR